MSESISRRTYSAAAQRVTEAFAGSPEMVEDYFSRGLIATNNLGLRMKVYTEGPESELGRFYFPILLSPRNCDLLEKARLQDPGLWDDAVATNDTRSDLSTQYFDALQSFGTSDARTIAIKQQLQDIQWLDAELRTRVFDIIDQGQLDPDEAMNLCR